MPEILNHRGEPVEGSGRPSSVGISAYLNGLLIVVGIVTYSAVPDWIRRLVPEIDVRPMEVLVRLTAVVLILTAVAGSISRYLRKRPDFVVALIRRVGRAFGKAGEWEVEQSRLVVLPDDNTNLIATLQDKLAQLDVTVREISASDKVGALTAGERELLFQSVREQTTERITEEFLQSIDERYGEAITGDGQHKTRNEAVFSMKRRLVEEIGALARRGNVNLIIGTLTTLIAVILLGYIVLQGESEAAPWQSLLPTYTLRLSLVVFVELFAFFFLRLYRSSLHEIKYFQNELTNIEIKALALESAIASKNTETIKAVLTGLARIERNFVLKKGESTSHLEGLRIDADSFNEAMSAMKTLAERIGK